jgi:hypothetical protein
MYSTVEDLFLWNQALSTDAPFSRAIRDQIFRPAANNWAYGWFVSRIPPGRPCADSMMAEMRGDMPGNYFSWMLRYPDKMTPSLFCVTLTGQQNTLKRTFKRFSLISCRACRCRI